MSIKKRAWAEVSLDAIANNIREVKRVTRNNAKILAVVKADAYGHGFLEVTHTLLNNGADALGVACIDEAIQLRNAGIYEPILILGHTPCEDAVTLVKHDIIPTVFTRELAKAVSDEAVLQNKTAKIHIKVDTGMTRVGFMYNENSTIQKSSVDEIVAVASLPNIEVDGIFTHLSSADEADTSYTEQQFGLFMELVKKLEENGLFIPTKHVCNSAGLLQYPHMHLDMVRPGIILYGVYPSTDMDKSKLNLIPAMQLKAIITNVKWVEKDTSVSYNRTYRTSEKTRVATIPIGYADGYSRVLSNKAKVIAGSSYAGIIGRICMDQCMIDVTDVNNISTGDEVVLFGSRENLSIPVEELANLIGTINYEILCVIGKRIPRVYTQNGKIVEVLNYLELTYST